MNSRALGFLLIGIGIVALFGFKLWVLLCLLPVVLSVTGLCPLDWGKDKHEWQEERPRRKSKSAFEVEENVNNMGRVV